MYHVRTFYDDIEEAMRFFLSIDKRKNPTWNYEGMKYGSHIYSIEWWD